MSRKLMWGLLLLGLVTLVAVALAQNDQAEVWVSVSMNEVQADDEFVATIHIQNAAGVYGSSIKLAFDPQVLSVVPQAEGAVEPGDFFAGQPELTLRNGVDSANGLIEYALTLRQPAEPVSGDGVLGTIRLHALAESPVAIQVTEAQLLAPQFEEVNGQQIASSVEAIPVAIQPMVVEANTAPPTVSQDSPAPDSGAPVAVTVQPANDATNPIAEFFMRLTDGSSPGVVIGTTFFVIGLVLFLIGLRMYARLYRRYGT